MTGTSKITEAGAALAAWTSQQEPTYPELSRNGWALYDALRALLDAVKAQSEPEAEDVREVLEQTLLEQWTARRDAYETADAILARFDVSPKKGQD